MHTKRVIFSTEEKEFLKHLVVKYAEVIECKKTDGQSIRKKSETWYKIENEFNSYEHHNKRTAKQLKKLWDNMKTEQKKQLSEEKKRRFQTFADELGDAIDSDSVALSKEGNIVFDPGANTQPSSPEQTMDLDLEVEDEHGTPFEMVTTTYEPPFKREEIDLTTRRTRKREQTGYIIDEMERLKKARTMNEQQKQKIHSLMEEELQIKINLSKLALEAQQQEMRQSAEAFRAEMAYKEKKWKLELEILEKQVNK